MPLSKHRGIGFVHKGGLALDRYWESSSIALERQWRWCTGIYRLKGIEKALFWWFSFSHENRKQGHQLRKSISGVGGRKEAGGLGRGDTGESSSGERASEQVGNMRHCQTVPRGHLMVGYGFYFQYSQAIFININFFLLGNFITKICHQLGSFSPCHIKQEVAYRHCEVILFVFICLLILYYNHELFWVLLSWVDFWRSRFCHVFLNLVHFILCWLCHIFHYELTW